jgi:hypothetical protein
VDHPQQNDFRAAGAALSSFRILESARHDRRVGPPTTIRRSLPCSALAPRGGSPGGTVLDGYDSGRMRFQGVIGFTLRQ